MLETTFWQAQSVSQYNSLLETLSYHGRDSPKLKFFFLSLLLITFKWTLPGEETVIVQVGESQPRLLRVWLGTLNEFLLSANLTFVGTVNMQSFLSFGRFKHINTILGCFLADLMIGMLKGLGDFAKIKTVKESKKSWYTFCFKWNAKLPLIFSFVFVNHEYSQC